MFLFLNPSLSSLEDLECDKAVIPEHDLEWDEAVQTLIQTRLDLFFICTPIEVTLRDELMNPELSPAPKYQDFP